MHGKDRCTGRIDATGLSCVMRGSAVVGASERALAALSALPATDLSL